MLDEFDRDHAAQCLTMEYLHQASHLPSIETASHPLAPELAGHDRNHVLTAHRAVAARCPAKGAKPEFHFYHLVTAFCTDLSGFSEDLRKRRDAYAQKMQLPPKREQS